MYRLQQAYEQGRIGLDHIKKDADIQDGDKIVTSNISDKYLPNILIGYVSSIEKDANNLTKSGLLVPAVDFEHLGEVLVITDMKQAPSSTETEQEPGEGL